MQKKGEIDNIDRNDKACDAEAKIDYGNLIKFIYLFMLMCVGIIYKYILGEGGGVRISD